MKRTLFALGASVLASLALVIAPAVAGNGNGNGKDNGSTPVADNDNGNGKDNGSKGTSGALAKIADSSGQAETHNKIPGKASGTLVLTYSPCATDVGVSASGLAPNSELWRYSTSTGWAYLGSVPSNGTTAILAAVAATGVSETWTGYAFPVGVDPANDGIGSALITSSPLSFTTCLPAGLQFSTRASGCYVVLTGTGLVPGSQIWIYSTFYNGWYGDQIVDSTGNFSSAITGGDAITDTLYAYNVAAGVTPHIVSPSDGTVLFTSGAFATGGCTV